LAHAIAAMEWKLGQLSRPKQIIRGLVFSSPWWWCDPDFDYVYWLVLVGVPPSPLSIKIIGLRGNFRQIFGFKGVNLQNIHNKGVAGCFLVP
jgi:hypothetical protein